MADDPKAVVSEALVDKIGAALAAKGTSDLNRPDLAARAEAVPEAAPAETPPAEKARDESGKFVKKELSPDAKGLLAAVKAEREKRKALESRLAEFEARTSHKEAPKPQGKDPSELLNRMPEETKKWAQDSGQEWINRLVEERLSATLETLKPDLEEVRAIRKQREETSRMVHELGEFVTDKALEGYEADPDAILSKIRYFEKMGVDLGPNKYDIAWSMLTAEQAPRTPSPEKVEEAKKKEAGEKARAGGVAPGSHVAVPPPEARKQLQDTVRSLGSKGDTQGIADIIGKIVPKHPLLK